MFPSHDLWTILSYDFRGHDLFSTIARMVLIYSDRFEPVRVSSNMKTCTKCDTIKPVSDFHKKSKSPDGLNAHCKDCRKQKASQQYQTNKRDILAANQKFKSERRKQYDKYKKTKSCERCGYSDYRALQWHHTDPNNKDGELSYLFMNMKWEKALAEAEKCEVLCANCHMIEHYTDRGH